MAQKQQPIHETIRHIRKQKGYSQEYIAERLGINSVNYGRLERGLTKLSLERLTKIAEILECDLKDLFQYTITSFSQEQQICSDCKVLIEKVINLNEIIISELKKISQQTKKK